MKSIQTIHVHENKATFKTYTQTIGINICTCDHVSVVLLLVNAEQTYQYLIPISVVSQETSSRRETEPTDYQSGLLSQDVP